MSASAVDEGAQGPAHKAAGHRWFHRMARVGLAGRGVIYLLIGVLAVQIGLGRQGGEADQKGALTTVIGTPGGIVVLWLIVFGFAGLALWQFAEARYGQPVPEGYKAHKRLGSFGRGLLYTLGFVGAVAFALGGRGDSSDRQSQAFTGRAMAEPGGRWLVLAIGAGFLCAGVVMAFKAIRRKFLEELKTGQMPIRVRQTATLLGVLGHCAQALVLGGIGVFLVYAAITFNADKAKGLDGTLREFAATPAGPWLLVAVAAGLALFGGYSFFEARWRKVEAVRA
jgi:hypothetical protein